MACQKPRVRSSQDKRSSRRAGIHGISFLSREEAAFLGGKKQLPQALAGWDYPRGHMGNRQHLPQARTESPGCRAGCSAQKSLRWAPATVGWDSWAPGHGTARVRVLVVLCNSAAAWLETLSIRARHMHKLHRHTHSGLSCLQEMCVVHQPLREVTPCINCWEINSRKIASKDHIFHRRGWSGWGFLSEFSRQKKGRGTRFFWVSLEYGIINLTVLPLLPCCEKQTVNSQCHSK